MSDWLELELAHHLAPVKAPEALWDRVQRPPQRVPRPLWPIAAILTMMAAAGVMWMAAKGQQPGVDLRRLTAQQLNTPPEFYSSNPREISEWARREAGLPPLDGVTHGNNFHALGGQT